MLNRAIKEAHKSNYRYPLGAIIFKGKRILSVGHNQIGRGTNKCSTLWSGSLHAEQAAILPLLKDPSKLKGASLLVTRLKSKGLLGLAKPCEMCMDLIRIMGIKEVLYTTNEGFLERIKL